MVSPRATICQPATTCADPAARAVAAGERRWNRRGLPRLPGLVEILLLDSRRPPDLIRAMADRALRRCVRHASAHVSFYRDLWASAGARPSDIATASDLSALPAVDKDMLVSAGAAAYDRTQDPSRFLTMRTSGTSGRAIVIQRTLRELRVVRRSILRQFLRIGVRPWHRIITFASSWARERRGLFIKLVCNTRHIAAGAGLDEQVATLSEFRPVCLMGQTGGIYLLARELLRRGTPCPLLYLVPTGATLMPDMRKTMREAFCVEPCDMYGAIEVGSIAWQCLRGNYHIDADRLIVEIVDDAGRRLPRGALGHVVVTSLYSYTMPFIRYRLHDIAAISTRTCDCGCRFPLLEPVQGRVNDFLPTPRGDLVSPHFFFHIFDQAGRNPVKDWRITQDDAHSLTYEYVPEPGFEPAALTLGLDLVQQRFGPECRINPVRVDRLDLTASGKRRCIVSKLRPSDLSLAQVWAAGDSGLPAAAGKRIADCGHGVRGGPASRSMVPQEHAPT